MASLRDFWKFEDKYHSQLSDSIAHLKKGVVGLTTRHYQLRFQAAALLVLECTTPWSYIMRVTMLLKELGLTTDSTGTALERLDL
jgi:hypothetical protein